MIKKIAIYVRVSTLEQAEHGYSINEQIEKLKKYCEIRDWHLYDTYIDPGFSGSNIERPSIKRLISDCEEKKFDTVLVYKLDRLSRSQKDTLYLIEDVFSKNNVDFVSLNENFDTSTSFGKAMIGILSVFAQLEREQIKERMQLGRLGRVRSGKAASWAVPPFGYTYNRKTGQLEINSVQSKIVEDIFSMYQSGISISKIADKLNIDGHIAKKRKWSRTSIKNILLNSTYCGIVEYKGNIFEGKHDPIITKESFERTKEELEIRQPKRLEALNVTKPFQTKYMLSGLVFCGYCHAPMDTLLGHVRKDGTQLRKYQCKNRFPKKTTTNKIYNEGKKCDSGYYFMEQLETTVINELLKLQNTPSLFNSITSKKSKNKEINIPQIKKDIKLIDDKINKITDLYINNIIDLEESKIRNIRFQKEKEFLINQLNTDDTTKEIEKLKEYEKIVKDFDFGAEDYDKQKILCNRLIEKIYIYKDKLKIVWKFEYLNRVF
ncbi:integrase [Floricoccus tropicus]|uniref:Integrase n=1 Tax=Floricoccus tropicus TaxID=1859473 RepID=A0A1E8GMU5_9LACT|nr:recombinase family protein [Floricoccus tropicus]OFI49562.1 integrase [Floricoccus tropicus]